MSFKPEDFTPLDPRPYRFKKAAFRFFCPLCRTQRAMTCRPRLSNWNYLQIFLTWLFMAIVLFPVMQFHSLYLIFVIWLSAEALVRLRFKKEVPCPHCGFDASWYKKDVKVARKKVAQFWDDQILEQKSQPSVSVEGVTDRSLNDLAKQNVHQDSPLENRLS